MLFRGTITTRTGADATARLPDERNKYVIFKNCTLFTSHISEQNNTQIVHAKDFDVVINTKVLLFKVL